MDESCCSTAYTQERPAGTASDARVIGKHFEYDYALNRQTKRYYAEGKLPATKTGTTLTYVQGDHLGSTSTLTGTDRKVVAKEKYSAFGERRRGEDARALVTDQLYTGQRLNVLSNLYHYSDGTSAGRFYDPLLGRFVQADPTTPTLPDAGSTPNGMSSGTTSTSGIRAGRSHAASSDDTALKDGPESSGFSTHSASLSSSQSLGGVRSNPAPAGPRSPKVDPQHLNRFSYVRNNPLRYIDPSGYWTVAITFIGGMGFAVLGVRADAIQVAFDNEGNIGVLSGVGGGGYAGGGGGLGPSIQVMSVPTVHDLKGWSVQIGLTGGEVVGGTGEVVFMQKGVGLAFGGKVTGEFPPAIPYGTAEHSWLWGTVNVWDFIPRPWEGR